MSIFDDLIDVIGTGIDIYETISGGGRGGYPTARPIPGDAPWQPPPADPLAGGQVCPPGTACTGPVIAGPWGTGVCMGSCAPTGYGGPSDAQRACERLGLYWDPFTGRCSDTPEDFLGGGGGVGGGPVEEPFQPAPQGDATGCACGGNGANGQKPCCGWVKDRWGNCKKSRPNQSTYWKQTGPMTAQKVKKGTACVPYQRKGFNFSNRKANARAKRRLEGMVKELSAAVKAVKKVK